MTERHLPPEPEHFAALVRQKMEVEGRKWTWLADDAGIQVDTLRYQLIKRPSSLKLQTARRVATSLQISMWGEAA